MCAKAGEQPLSKTVPNLGVTLDQLLAYRSSELLECYRFLRLCSGWQVALPEMMLPLLIIRRVAFTAFSP
jgi:hypothetical protein